MKNDESAPKTDEQRTPNENAAKDASDEPKTPRRYEFKIAPVDPKNNFDFEDVADK